MTISDLLEAVFNEPPKHYDPLNPYHFTILLVNEFNDEVYELDGSVEVDFENHQIILGTVD